MGFFNNLFSTSNSGPDQPDIQFGRFSDSHKHESKYDAWDKSLAHFAKAEYIKAYEQFFTYLSDDEISNVIVEGNRNVVKFTLYQGSKVIQGKADHKKFYAEAKIAKLAQPNISVFRRLLEDNFLMKHARYAIDRESNITIIFSTHSIDSSPYKLYYALKELATSADKTDDVLISQYSELEPINTQHIRKIKVTEKKAKYEYFTSSIRKVIETVDTTSLNLSKHPGAISYLYLDLVYRMDYLIKPEGSTMNTLSGIDQLYFADKVTPIEQKNNIIKHELIALLDLDFKDFSKEIYEVNSTFGMNSTSGKSKITDFIESELDNMDWYINQGHMTFAAAIPSYIVGYCLYRYSMTSPMRALLQLYYRIMEHEYFTQLDYNDLFFDGKNKLAKSKIKKTIQNIISTYTDRYLSIDPDFQLLMYDNKVLFAKSYLTMLSRIEFTRKDNR